MRDANWLAVRLRHLCTLIAAAAGAPCIAGVITIHEGGPTVPISQYLAAFFAQEGEPAEDLAGSSRPSLPVAFPVRTESMRPGRLPAPVQMPAAKWLASPMFLLGDDALSTQWLAANRQRLHRAGASGLVVNVASLQAFRALRATASELPMAMGSADEFARQSGLSVYPLFVSSDGQVSQQVP